MLQTRRRVAYKPRQITAASCGSDSSSSQVRVHMAPTATAPAHILRSTSMSSSADTAYSRRRRLQPVSRFTLRACDVPLVVAYLLQGAPGGIRAAISRRPRRQALASTFGGATTGTAFVAQGGPVHPPPIKLSRRLLLNLRLGAPMGPRPRCVGFCEMCRVSVCPPSQNVDNFTSSHHRTAMRTLTSMQVDTAERTRVSRVRWLRRR